MRRIKLLLSVVALAFVTSVAAENNKAFFGADLAILKYTGSESGDEYDPLIMGGFSAGYLRTFPLGKSGLGVDVGAGIQYTSGTTTYSFDYSLSGGSSYEYESKTTLFNINIPAVIAYRIGSSDSFAFRPYAGVNFRLGLSAKEEYTETIDGESESITYNNYDKDDVGDNTAKRFKTGVVVGGDFEFSKWSIGYQWGGDFGEIAKDSDTKYSWHTLRFAFKF